MHLVIGDLASDKKVQGEVGGGYDVVCANILADIIIGMLPAIRNTIRPEGVLLTSGIIDFKEEEVKNALYENGFKVYDIKKCGEWVSTAVKQTKE